MQSKNKKPEGALYLIDAMSQIHRALHAPLRELTAPDGEPTKVTYLFLRMLLKLQAGHKIKGLMVAFDAPRHTLHRRKFYPPYKAHRDSRAPSTELGIQIKRIRQFLKYFNIPVLEQSGHEADDLIASVVDTYQGEFDIVIVSRDKDLEQLLSDSVKMFDPQDDRWLDARGVEKKRGIRPDQMSDYLALVGDSSDNLPGVIGIGPKTARRLLNEFGDIDNIYKNLNSLPKTLQKRILHSDLRVMQKLTRLRCDLEIQLDPEDFEFKGINIAKGMLLIRALGMHSLLDLAKSNSF